MNTIPEIQMRGITTSMETEKVSDDGNCENAETPKREQTHPNPHTHTQHLMKQHMQAANLEDALTNSTEDEGGGTIDVAKDADVVDANCTEVLDRDDQHELLHVIKANGEVKVEIHLDDAKQNGKVVDTNYDQNDNYVDSDNEYTETTHPNTTEPATSPKLDNEPLATDAKDDISTPPRRVKLYHLADESWSDRGTGYCSVTLDPTPRFHVVDEQEPHEVLLDAPIEGSTQYQRQQDTLIVWTSDDGIDYALSFQEPEGCLEVCSFLINLQREKIRPQISLVAVIQTAEGEVTEMIAGPIPSLPIADEENLPTILDVLAINQYRNRVTGQILENNAEWVLSLVRVFQACEREHKLNSLYCLNDIVKTLFYFLDVDVYEVLIRKDIFVHVLGMLEYDPDFSGSKMNWREYVKKKVHFKEVVKFDDDDVKNEIVKCFNITFLREVVLVGLDESIMKCLETMRQNQEAKAIQFLESDLMFLDVLFKIYDNGENDDHNDDCERACDCDCEKAIRERKIESVKLMKQFAVASKSLQAFQRTKFYSTLIDKGLMKMIEFAISEKEVESRILVGEIIVIIIDYDIQIFKDANSEILMKLLINILINEKPAGLKTQAYQAIRALVNPSQLLESQDELDAGGPGDVNVSDLIDEKFFTDFYDNSALSLFQPVIDMIDYNADHADDSRYYGNTSLKTREDSLALEYICELLNFVAKCHETIYSRSFILENHLLKGINKIIGSQLKMQLRLSAIRCLRTIILLDDEFYTRYVIENDILQGFMKIVDNSNRFNNMVSSACLSVLSVVQENMHLTNFQLLARHMAERYTQPLRANSIGEKIWDSLQEEEEPQTEADEDTIIIHGSSVSVSVSAPPPPPPPPVPISVEVPASPPLAERAESESETPENKRLRVE
jgi:protein phosphatase 4 regulatory subunit 3